MKKEKKEWIYSLEQEKECNISDATLRLRDWKKP